VCDHTGQGGLEGSDFCFFLKQRERKRNPPHAKPAWTRLALITGARLPQNALNPADLAEPGPAWRHAVT
jgi:hypothetical protein